MASIGMAVVKAVLVAVLVALVAAAPPPAPAEAEAEAAASPLSKEPWAEWLQVTRTAALARPATATKVASTLHALDALGQAQWADDERARQLWRKVAEEADDGTKPSAFIQRMPPTTTGAGQQAAATVLALMVDVDVVEVTDHLLAHVVALGGEVVYASARFRTVRARLPVGTLETLAQHPLVKFVAPGLPPRVSKINTSEGVTAFNVSYVWSALGSTGAGVKVGVLSDSASAAEIVSLQKSGDLHDVYVVQGQENSGTDEGCAMMEIVYDMAPSATIIFATGAVSEAGMADNILLLAEAGCEVIVDDIGWSGESPLHDTSYITDAVNNITLNAANDSRVVYASAAGNANHVSSGYPTVWAGVFTATATYYNNWGSGLGRYLPILGAYAPQGILLWWSDPLGGSTNDYGVALVDGAGQVVAISDDLQNGTQDPNEVIADLSNLDFTNNEYRIVVYGNPPFQPRYLWVSLWGCALNECYLAAGTSGSTFGHPTAAGAFGIGAVPVPSNGASFQNTPNLQSEIFSSDGPARIFYGPDGVTPYTPGNVTTGGITRKTPMFSGADGISAATPGFDPFYGTSAAAPHVAALVALIKSSVSSSAYVTRAGIASMLMATAQRVGTVDSTGYNSVSGWGLPNIAPIVAALEACGPGQYVNTTSLACTNCTNGRAIPEGSAGVDACTSPSTLPGATQPPASTSVSLTYYSYAAANSLSAGAIAGICIACIAVAALVAIIVYMAVGRKGRVPAARPIVVTSSGPAAPPAYVR